MKELGRREQEQKDIALARASAATTGKASEVRKLEDKERTQQQVIQDVLKTDKRKPSAKQAREKEQAASRKRLEKIRQTEKEKKNIRLAKASAAITQGIKAMDDIQVPDKLAWQQNRRRIAYIAMFTMVATVVASFVFPERAKEIPAMDVLFISLAAVIGAFFGADAMVSKKK